MEMVSCYWLISSYPSVSFLLLKPKTYSAFLFSTSIGSFTLFEQSQISGSPIWKPRDQGGNDWDGSESEASEPRGPGHTPGHSGHLLHDTSRTVAFQPNNGKKETLQSACKRK